jgi:hypothetical protein
LKGTAGNRDQNLSEKRKTRRDDRAPNVTAEKSWAVTLREA